jgi:hypothetical protein
MRVWPVWPTRTESKPQPGRTAAIVVLSGDVAEWFRQRTANPCTWVRFPSSPPEIEPRSHQRRGSIRFRLANGIVRWFFTPAPSGVRLSTNDPSGISVTWCRIMGERSKAFGCTVSFHLEPPLSFSRQLPEPALGPRSSQLAGHAAVDHHHGRLGILSAHLFDWRVLVAVEKGVC